MTRPGKLESSVVDWWLEGRAPWARADDALVRVFSFPDFRCALAFVVSVGCWAERHDHHPDVELGWGRVRLRWSTHDAGGITQLDLDAAEASDGGSASMTGDEGVDAARAELRARLHALVGEGDLPRLDEALTHRSFGNEEGAADNQRLEFLGDAVLGLCVSEMLVELHPDADEGRLTRMRSALVNAGALADWARQAQLGASIAFGRGARLGSEREETNVLADAAEAVVAAVFVARGLEGARALVRDLVGGVLAKVGELAAADPKSALQERVQALGLPAPTYRLVEARGQPPAEVFEVEVMVGDRGLARGEGRSKRTAERMAAEQALALPIEAPPRDVAG